jgi:hypothetical protein
LYICTRYCGVEQWQLVGLITQRSEVRILPPLQNIIDKACKTITYRPFDLR